MTEHVKLIEEFERRIGRRIKDRERGVLSEILYRSFLNDKVDKTTFKENKNDE